MQMIYILTKCILELDTGNIRESEPLIYQSKLSPKKIVEKLFSTEPFTANLIVTAELFNNYCDLKIMVRGNSNQNERELFRREENILSRPLKPFEANIVDYRINSKPQTVETTLEINVFGLNSIISQGEVEEVVITMFPIKSSRILIEKAEIGASAEFLIIKIVVDSLKYIFECIKIFMDFKKLIERKLHGGVNPDYEEDIDLEEFGLSEIEGYKIAISKHINVPINRINVKVKLVRLDGLYMMITTENGDYSVEFNNKRQLIVLKPLN